MRERSVIRLQQLILFLLFGMSLLFGCQSGDKTPNVSHIPVHVQITSFDHDFMTMDTLRIQDGLKKLEQKYPLFYPIYMNKIMQFHAREQRGKKIDEDSLVRQYITNKDIENLQEIIHQKFPPDKIKELQKELKKSFRYIKYYIPDFTPPKVITFSSALSNYGAITIDSILGIGLDMFLGEDFPLYQKVSPPYPSYLLHRFNENHLIPSCIKVIAQDQYPPPSRGTLLAQMVAQGKILYFMDKVLPHTPDSLKINYTDRQMTWCKANEQFIWQYFIQKNLLFNKKPLTIRYYIGVAPTARGMPQEAPGNIGSWVGWQIVKAYMKKYPKTTLPQLMALKGNQDFLNKSGYQPH